METSSWPLRLALLAIGLGVLGAIWLWAQLRRRRELNRSYERKVRSLRMPALRGTRASADEMDDGDPRLEAERGAFVDDDYEIIVKPREQRIDELPKITRDPDAPGRGRGRPSAIASEDAAGARSQRRRRDRQIPLGFEEDTPPLSDSMRPRTERDMPRGSPEPGAGVKAGHEVLALYLRPLRDAVFRGATLLRGFNTVGLKFGEMGIYHHYGAGDLRSDRPLFSVANMFEPGYFDPAAMDDFETAGLALFIQLPAPLDGPVAFEFFLNTAQRLAEALDADLLGDPNRTLDSATIEGMRQIAARYSEDAR